MKIHSNRQGCSLGSSGETAPGSPRCSTGSVKMNILAGRTWCSVLNKFKLLSQIKGNEINDSGFSKVYNFSQG
jgi:hypothetical protein